MKRNISDILHNADDETIERIADKKQAADSRTSERIYRKCLSRMGTDAEQVEVFKAETVRRAPRLYPVFAAVLCLIIIGGTVAAMLKFKAHAPLPEDNDPQIMATVTTMTETTDVTGTYTTAKSSSKTDTDATSAAAADKSTVTEKTSAENSVRETDVNAKTVTALVNGTTARKTTASKTTKTSKTTTTTTDAYSLNQKPKYLTTKDIISLSQKGDALTWSDFEGYVHEDIGSGIYIWEFKIEEGSGYTLRVGGVPPEKPNYINLCRGINKSLYTDVIDIRYDDVQSFLSDWMNETYAISIINKKMDYDDLSSKTVQSISISNPDPVSNNVKTLNTEKKNEILKLIKNIKLLERYNDYSDTDISFLHITLVGYNGKIVDLNVSSNAYFTISGNAYKAAPDSCLELFDYIWSALCYADHPVNIDLSNGQVQRWADFMNVDPSKKEAFYESVNITALPELRLIWNGSSNCITIKESENTVASVDGMPLWNAYFTDLNNDGLPELCVTVSFGSGMVDEHIIVYDLRNKKEYTLWERMENDYVLFMENNELFVRKIDTESSLSSNWEKSRGEKGKLKINSNDELVFVPVS